MFLTEAEIAELTQRQRHDAQIRALRFMGIEHAPRADGSVVVLRAHVEHLLGGVANATVSKEVQPDWGAI